MEVTYKRDYTPSFRADKTIKRYAYGKRWILFRHFIEQVNSNTCCSIKKSTLILYCACSRRMDVDFRQREKQSCWARQCQAIEAKRLLPFWPIIPAKLSLLLKISKRFQRNTGQHFDTIENKGFIKGEIPARTMAVILAWVFLES